MVKGLSTNKISKRQKIEGGGSGSSGLGRNVIIISAIALLIGVSHFYLMYSNVETVNSISTKVHDMIQSLQKTKNLEAQNNTLKDTDHQAASEGAQQSTSQRKDQNHSSSSQNEDKQNKKEDDGAEYVEYTIPTLKETIEYNKRLLQESHDHFKHQYDVGDDEEAAVTIQKLEKFLQQVENSLIDPYFAYKINQPESNPNLNKIFFGLYRDNNFCVMSDIYHLTHEREFYEQITLFSDWQDEYTRFELLSTYSMLAAEQYGYDLPEGYFRRESFALPININQYYLNRPMFLHALSLGNQFGCLFQGYNKIPNSGSFTKKAGLAESYKRFKQQLKENPSNHSEECKKEFQFLPNTYNLNVKQECLDFFTYINSEEYQKRLQKHGFQFITKLGSNVHQGKGIHLMDENVLKTIVEEYKNGEECGNKIQKNDLLVQEYISNPLTVKGKKFEVRLHFVVVSVNPLIIYSQAKGGVALCALPFDAFDEQIQRHICVYDIARQLLDLDDDELMQISGKTREEYMKGFSYQFTLESLQEELTREGVSHDYIDKEFLPKVFRNFIHTLLMTKDKLCDDSRFFEMYAPDILVDKTTMNPMILEYNTNPRMVLTSEFVHDWNLSTLKDIAQINIAYVRSRYYRIKKILEEFINEVAAGKETDNHAYIERIREANKNRLEPQFQFREGELSSYIKIYDETDPEDIFYKGTLIFDKKCSH